MLPCKISPYWLPRNRELKDQYFIGYSDVRLKIVRGMLRADVLNVKHYGEGGRGRICVEFGRSNGEQQTVNKYADHTRGGEHRPRRGYRWNRGEAFGEGEFAFLKLRARALRNNATEWREHRADGERTAVTHAERVYDDSETNLTAIVSSLRKQVSPQITQNFFNSFVAL